MLVGHGVGGARYQDDIDFITARYQIHAVALDFIDASLARHGNSRQESEYLDEILEALVDGAIGLTELLTMFIVGENTFVMEWAAGRALESAKKQGPLLTSY